MKSKLPLLIVTFVVGILIGCSIIWLCCGSCNKSSCKAGNCKVCQLDSLTSQLTLINTKTAHAYYKLYHSRPDSIETLKGFTINLAQFHAMCMIMNADTSGTLHGFRIYMGADSIPSNRVMMVVGTGSPDKYGTIYSTSAENSGPCPLICDSDSPIISDDQGK